MTRDLTQGGELKAMVLFSLPIIAGNLLQQLYNVVDTLIVGRVLGPEALAAVGSSYTLMVFLTSVNLGFCLGSGALFAQLYGARRQEDLKTCVANAFVLIGAMTLAVNLLAYLLLDPLMRLLRIQPEVWAQTREYLLIVLSGMVFTFLFNFVAAVLRSMGNSFVPLVFLGASALLNILLDLLFVLPLRMGVGGAALATVIAQGVSALAVCVYFWHKAPAARPGREHFRVRPALLRQVGGYSVLTSVQQSVMNFGILLIQGLVNSFGVAAMAGFATAVKIDTLAYMPVSDFGNAFSTFVAQNYGAGQPRRVQRGLRWAVAVSVGFSLITSLFVWIFARDLMAVFVDPGETQVLDIGAHYLRVEGSFYCLIGILMLFYSLYRGMGQPGISVILTVISLGTRVALAHLAAPVWGLSAVWWAIPIGWLLADAAGFLIYCARKRQMFQKIP